MPSPLGVTSRRITYFRTYNVAKRDILLASPSSWYNFFLLHLRLYPNCSNIHQRSPRVGDDEIVAGRSCTYIVILAESEELPDLGGALGSEALGVDDVGQTGDVVLADLDDRESKDGEVLADDAAADGLSPALTGATSSVARVAFGEEESDTGRVHDALLHGETLLVVTAGDADNVALPLVAQAVGGDLSAHL